jgi:putative membrane protein
MQGPYTQSVYEFGWKYSGQVYIVLGMLAALVHSAPRWGWGKAFAVFAVASGVALLSELGGTNVGLPFGPYHYTPMLGYMIAGDVPYAIPISWYYMLYGSLAICARLLAADDSSATRWRWALVAGAFLTAWDVPMEVQMTNIMPAHWVWDLHKLPAWVPDWLGAPLFYGMPLSNWVGWYVTGVIVSRLMLRSCRLNGRPPWRPPTPCCTRRGDRDDGSAFGGWRGGGMGLRHPGGRAAEGFPRRTVEVAA